jgi:hypothetical protein
MGTHKTETLKRWQRNQLAKGLCIRCTQPLATSRHCRRHADQFNEKIKRKQKRRPSQGLCRRTGCKRPLASATLCPVHLVQLRKSVQARREAHRAFGLCLWCRRPALAGRAFCEVHVRQPA